MSPFKSASESDFLIHSGIGLTPETRVLPFDPINLEFGTYQMKWVENHNYSWYYSSISTSFSKSDFSLYFSWTHLFGDDWNHEQFLTAISQRVNEKLYLNAEIRLYKDSGQIKLRPSITISTIL